MKRDKVDVIFKRYKILMIGLVLFISYMILSLSNYYFYVYMSNKDELKKNNTAICYSYEPNKLCYRCESTAVEIYSGELDDVLLCHTCGFGKPLLVLDDIFIKEEK